MTRYSTLFAIMIVIAGMSATSGIAIAKPCLTQATFPLVLGVGY